MYKQALRVGVFILAKNESANIDRTLSALVDSGWDVHLLDSGSTDGTQLRAEAYPNVRVIPYDYVDHCRAYNDITSEMGCQYQVAIVLDADMVVIDRLRNEVEALMNGGGTNWEALKAPIEMWVDGHPLRRGSLCPPKVFALRTGKPLFVNTGHAEKLQDDVRVLQTRAVLIHDDRKHYSSFLLSQGRYASKLAERYERGEVSGRDRLRVRTPLLIGIVPFVSYVLKGGLFSGRAGLLYALDRLIAEAIMFRHSVARTTGGSSQQSSPRERTNANE